MSKQGQDELHNKGVGGPGRPAPLTRRGIPLTGGTPNMSTALHLDYESVTLSYGGPMPIFKATCPWRIASRLPYDMSTPC
jgi:hypothetical protein